MATRDLKDAPTSESNAVAKIGLKWVDVLEREFDTAFVDLDTCLNQLDEDSQDVAFDARGKMTILSTSFAQLVHKSNVIFAINSRLEEEVVNMRNQLMHFHPSYMEGDPLMSTTPMGTMSTTSMGTSTMSLPNGKTNPMMSTSIPQQSPQRIINSLSKEVNVLRRENRFLRNSCLSVQSDLFGARLASKYLDKELAGRIQQIQLLAKSELKGFEHDRLWNQLEAEIHLHRHKTVARACRGKSGVKLDVPDTDGVRQVVLEKGPNDGLGISITGGKDHGVPVIVSEVHPDSIAHQSGQIYVGDAILSCNKIALRDVKHHEAAMILSNQTGDCILELSFLSLTPEEDYHPMSTSSSSLQQHHHRHQDHQGHQFFHPDVMTEDMIDRVQSFHLQPEVSPVHVYRDRDLMSSIHRTSMVSPPPPPPPPPSLSHVNVTSNSCPQEIDSGRVSGDEVTFSVTKEEGITSSNGHEREGHRFMSSSKKETMID